MNYKIYIGDSTCTKCGKRHKKIFEIDGNPYGSTCANEILGKNLTAPVWLYELAEEWIQKDYQVDYEEIEDSSTNFFGQYEALMPEHDGQLLWNNSIIVDGKRVKVEWQYEINDYIIKRYEELRK